MKRTVACLLWTAYLVASPAQAQLLREETRDDQRVCTYLGSQQLPNDTIVERTLVLEPGQPCPAAAPYSDPDQPPPSNAALRSETTDASSRTCTYEQGGIDYALSVPLSVRCAMTPALLKRSLDQR